MRSETLARSSSGASFRTGCTRKESRVAGTEFDGRPICAPAVAPEKNIRDAAATRIVVLLFIYEIRKELMSVDTTPHYKCRSATDCFTRLIIAAAMRPRPRRSRWARRVHPEIRDR